LKIVNSELEKKVKDRLELAKKWYEKFGKPMIVEFKVSDVEKKAITELIEMVKKENDGEKLQYEIFEIAKKSGIKPVKFFQLIYKIILNQDKGPRLGPYIIERGKEEIIEKFEKNI
jgi:lysyl-tRNA synthetase class 1